MRILVKRFDHFLSHRYKIFEFSQDLECLLRLRWEHARREVRFDDHLIQPGTPLLELHLWNDHLPTISGDGADLSYALHIRRLILKSFRLLAQELAGNPQYSGVQAVYGLTALVEAGARAGREKLAQRLGFSLLPYQPLLGRFGAFWEYLYTRALVWTYNPGGLRHLRFSGFQRSEIWMLKEDLIQRFLVQAIT